MFNHNSKIAYRYARALLSLASEEQIAGQVNEDMQYIHKVFSSSKELKIILKSPVVREGKKQRIIQQLFEGKIHPLLLGYIRIIVRKQRANLLDGIAAAYLKVYMEAMGIEVVELTTAIPVNDELKEKALMAARKLTKMQVIFREKVNPDIMGGFILNLGDKQYDASVQKRLRRIKKHLNIR
jgi:F-type H+-transporting ATPase subunit delta